MPPWPLWPPGDARCSAVELTGAHQAVPPRRPGAQARRTLVGCEEDGVAGHLAHQRGTHAACKASRTVVPKDARHRCSYSRVAARLHPALDQLGGAQHDAERHAGHCARGQRVPRFAKARRWPRGAAAVGESPARRVVDGVVHRRLQRAAHERGRHPPVQAAHLRGRARERTEASRGRQPRELRAARDAAMRSNVPRTPPWRRMWRVASSAPAC